MKLVDMKLASSFRRKLGVTLLNTSPNLGQSQWLKFDFKSIWHNPSWSPWTVQKTRLLKKHPDPVSDIYLHVSHPGYVFDLPPNSLEESLGAQPYLQFHRFEGHVWKTDLSRTRCPRSVDLPNSAKVHSLSSAACHLPCATEMSVRSPFLQVLWCKASLGLKIRPFSINGYHKTVSLCQLRGKIINWSERITRNPDIFDRQIYRFP